MVITVSTDLNKPPCHTAGDLGSGSKWAYLFGKGRFCPVALCSMHLYAHGSPSCLWAATASLVGSHPQGIPGYPTTNPFQHHMPSNHSFGYKALWYIWPFEFLQDPSHPSPRAEWSRGPDSARLPSMFMALTVLSSQHSPSLELLPRCCIPEA